MNKGVFDRVYKTYSLSKLLRLKTFLIFSKSETLVKNMNKIYSIACKTIGMKNTNSLIKTMYGDIFFGGENPLELETHLKEFNKDEIITIADYAREFLTAEEEAKDIDIILRDYVASIQVSTRVDGKNCIALKISSFTNIDNFKLLNTLQLPLTNYEDDKIQNSTRDHILDKMFPDSNIFDLNFYEIVLSKNPEKIANIQNFLEIDNLQMEKIISFVTILDQRLSYVLDYAQNNNCLVMMDGEQTYLQIGFDSIAAYYYRKYNKEKCMIANTFQCYLTSHSQKITNWLLFCRNNNLKFGVKLVRGAYMNEENNLAEKLEKVSPINSTIELTHSNYNNTIDLLFKNYVKGDKYCLGTHNLGSLEIISQKFEEYGKNEDILTAQVLGMAEYATKFCKERGMAVAKYVPFGKFEIMIPYLIRRMEESKISDKLEWQGKMINEEIIYRIKNINKH